MCMFDTIIVNTDTIEYIVPENSIRETTPPQPVFTEEILYSNDSKNYPLHKNIKSDLTSDWIFYMIIGFLVIVSWLRVFNSKYLISNFTALFNYHRATKLYSERNIIQQRVSALLNVIYFLSFGLYLFLIFIHFQWHPANLSGFMLFLTLTGLLVLLFLVRVLLMKLTGFIFVRTELFSAYLFHYYLTNKALGLVMIPFSLAIAYTSGMLTEITIFLSLFVVSSAFVLRLVRTIMFIIKNEVLLFYLILYLCTVELLPFLVILKMILSSTKVY